MARIFCDFSRYLAVHEMGITKIYRGRDDGEYVGKDKDGAPVYVLEFAFGRNRAGNPRDDAGGRRGLCALRDICRNRTRDVFLIV